MPPTLTERYQQALEYTFQLHSHQTRKGNETPYLAHLLSVSALVLENGGDEDQAIAALLHDAVEDQGGVETLNVIEQRFGPNVARIVDGCTDAYAHPKPPWRERKTAYLSNLKTSDKAILLVSLADKVHNAKSILNDLQSGQENVWEKFNGGKDGTLWYYSSLADIFDQSPFIHLKKELRTIVDEIQNISKSQSRKSS
jgi:GTP pyrophosphokinase